MEKQKHRLNSFWFDSEMAADCPSPDIDHVSGGTHKPSSGSRHACQQHLLVKWHGLSILLQVLLDCLVHCETCHRVGQLQPVNQSIMILICLGGQKNTAFLPGNYKSLCSMCEPWSSYNVASLLLLLYMQGCVVDQYCCCCCCYCCCICRAVWWINIVVVVVATAAVYAGLCGGSMLLLLLLLLLLYMQGCVVDQCCCCCCYCCCICRAVW